MDCIGIFYGSSRRFVQFVLYKHGKILHKPKSMQADFQELYIELSMEQHICTSWMSHHIAALYRANRPDRISMFTGSDSDAESMPPPSRFVRTRRMSTVQSNGETHNGEDSNKCLSSSGVSSFMSSKRNSVLDLPAPTKDSL